MGGVESKFDYYLGKLQCLPSVIILTTSRLMALQKSKDATALKSTNNLSK